MKKLAVFDFDSTIMDGETMDILARELGFEGEVRKITELGMRGEIDFFESLVARAKFLKGLEVSKVDSICHSLLLVKGAEKVVKELKEQGWIVVCFSGGFVNATNYFARKLGMDADFANVLKTKNGLLTGEIGGEMMFDFSKGVMLKKLQSILKISPDNTLAVGDGANDKSMFEHAAKKVAFCAKNTLKEKANIIIDDKDLTKIIDYI